MRLTGAFACAVAAHFVNVALGQQGPFGDSAIQPSKGVVGLRQTATFTRYGGDPAGVREDLSDLRLETTATYGLTGDLALQAVAPVVYRSWDEGGGDEDDLGVGDPSLALRWRFWQRDSVGADTRRAALIIGAELPFGDSEYSSRSVDPFVGVAYSAIEGRWAWNGSARLKLNTSGASRVTPGDFAEEALFLDGSVLYRLSPKEWGADTDVSTYLILEVNALFETGGDAEVLVAPGFLWESREVVWEVGVQVPVVRDVEDRFGREWGLRVGGRVLF